MTLEEAIVGVVRLASALPVLRWPLAGAILAIAIDFSDLLLMGGLPLGGLRDYQTFDKLADLAYLASFFAVTRRWASTDRSIASALLAYRLVGVALFLASHDRVTLVAFPNLFEAWFLLVCLRDRYRPGLDLLSRAGLPYALTAAAAKLAQEWLIHYTLWLDRYAATEILADAWQYLTKYSRPEVR